MKRVMAWTVSGTLMVAGLLCHLSAMSLLMPATNPVSAGAPRFQANVLQATFIAALFLLLSEAAARRWSAPARGWRAGWLLIGGLFLVVALPVLASTLEEATPLARRTLRFRLQIGLLDLVLGIAACGVGALALRRR